MRLRSSAGFPGHMRPHPAFPCHREAPSAARGRGDLVADEGGAEGLAARARCFMERGRPRPRLWRCMWRGRPRPRCPSSGRLRAAALQDSALLWRPGTPVIARSRAAATWRSRRARGRCATWYWTELLHRSSRRNDAISTVVYSPSREAQRRPGEVTQCSIGP
jgi:hypothetical protein